jgi:hypothetical protein
MFPSYSERSIDSIIFNPGSNYPDGLRFLEVGLQGPTNNPSIKEDHLNEATIGSWIENSGERDIVSSDKGGIRLILAERTAQPNVFNHFPFSEETFKIVFEGFELPDIYPACLIPKIPHYTHLASRNAVGHQKLSFISRTLSYRQGAHALALTYNVQTKITSAIIQGDRDPQYLVKLCKYLKERADLAVHSALLLLVASQLEYQTTDQNYLPLRNDMIRIEKCTGHGLLVNKSYVTNLNLFQGLPTITRELNIFFSKVISETERVKSCLLRHECIIDFIDNLDRHCLELDSKSTELKQHAEFLTTGWKSLLHRYEAFEKNVQVQLAVLYNTSVQRDSKLNLGVVKSSASIAAASKRDGSVMKSISLLTMLFLPATFVSTLFAMPLFNWSVDHISAVATSHA